MPLRFRLATREDDAALRRAFSATPMEGGMRLAFEREPSFFEALRVQGDDVQVMVCEDTGTGEIVATGTRAISQAFVNGMPLRVGYLSDLRILPAWRKGTVLTRGWSFFRTLDDDRQVDLYHTAIFSENADARGALAKERTSVPQYHPLGSFITAGIHASRETPSPTSHLRVTRGSALELPRIVKFLNAHHASRLFAPVHRMEDFAPGGRWRDFHAEDFFLVWNGSQLCGVAGVWDQSAFKQTRVLGYAGKWRWLYLLSRLTHRVLPVPRLPSPGDHFRFGYGCFLAIPSQDPEVFRLLIDAMRTETFKRKWMHLLVSLHESDPLLPALEGIPHTPFRGELFWVNPRSTEAVPAHPQIPHVEAALL
jgi:hypothetical protein